MHYVERQQVQYLSLSWKNTLLLWQAAQYWDMSENNQFYKVGEDEMF